MVLSFQKHLIGLHHEHKDILSWVTNANQILAWLGSPENCTFEMKDPSRKTRRVKVINCRINATHSLIGVKIGPECGKKGAVLTCIYTVCCQSAQKKLGSCEGCQ